MVDAAEAQRAFVARVHGRLVGSLHLYTGDRDLAYELAQEALARACRDWISLAGMDAPGAWVYRVALNLAHLSQGLEGLRSQLGSGEQEEARDVR